MNPKVSLLGIALGLCLSACTDRPSTAPVAAPAAAPAAEATPADNAEQVQPREPDEDDEVTAVEAGVTYMVVDEAFLTASTPDDNVDSPTSWQAPDGATWLLASAKGSHRVLVYDGDSGASLRQVGEKGKDLGEFKRPNGVAVIDDLLFVVERDNRRVQVLRLPGFEALGAFGRDELQQPYGLWARKHDGGYEVLVSDAYMSAADDDMPPPVEQLDKRYKRYAVNIEADLLSSRLLGHVGATDAAGAIRIPESLQGDVQNDRLLLAEEDQADSTRHKIYDLRFNYSGQDLGRGLFKAQAEGIALWTCADGSGYWITTDQFTDRSVFHVFDRQTLVHRGGFAGKVTANTDGVWLQQKPTRAFPMGVFYAVHDDQAVAAFDWRAVAEALSLRGDCSAAE